jgi:hypothetical protein
MPRPRNAAAHVSQAVDQLIRAVTGLVESVTRTARDARQVGAAAKQVKLSATSTGRRSALRSRPRGRTTRRRSVPSGSGRCWRGGG